MFCHEKHKFKAGRAENSGVPKGRDGAFVSA
jgi:hypothetical protein